MTGYAGRGGVRDVRDPRLVTCLLTTYRQPILLPNKLRSAGVISVEW